MGKYCLLQPYLSQLLKVPMHLLETILAQMSSINQPQRQFIAVWRTTLTLFHGKATFRNLSRYSDFNEKTYARGCRRSFNLVEFNRLARATRTKGEKTLIAAMDCSFTKKSGKHTYGLGKF